MESFLAIVSAEFEAWQAAADKRGHVGQRAGAVYDAFVAPLDIPYVPDAVESTVDAIGRAAAVKVATAIYDGIMAKLAKGIAVSASWPVIDATSEPVGEDALPSAVQD